MDYLKLNDDEIVEKVIDCFLSVEGGKEVSFTGLLLKSLNINSLNVFNHKDLFSLYNKFIDECKKRKIKIVFRQYGGPVGLPYSLGFWRIERADIKKIVYNKAYGCYGMKGELSRDYVIFQPDKVTYCSEPLYNYSNKGNCFIKISYCLYNNDEFEDSLPCPDIEERQYNFDFIRKEAERIINKQIDDFDICDVTPASIIVYYTDGKKHEKSNLPFIETELLDHFFEIFAPESFKKAVGSFYDEEIEE